MTNATPELLAALRPLLDQALDLTQPERDAWLARLRREQPVYAAELEMLLSAEAGLDAQGFLSDQPWEDLPRSEPSLGGRRLGPYTLERPLGQGGMGTVWLARRNDGRYEGRVAVKLLKLALFDPVGGERFRREGTVLARLTHPNIARLYDAGVTDDGQPFLVLEYVEGERIDRYCDAQRLTPVRRLERFLEVLSAVGHAHANLIVHRDLKPSNILVTSDGAVKLLDFGIAKLLEAEEAGEPSTLTDLGGRALTPEYAAPEQVAGGAVTTATDVYALGVLLYLLLAGRHPTGAAAWSVTQNLRAIMDTEPPRLSTALTAMGEPPDGMGGLAETRSTSLTRLRRVYAGDLENILAKALKKRPEERYPTVGAFADDLRRYLNHEPVSARPDALVYRTSKFLRRNRSAVMVSATVFLALLAATVVTTGQMIDARRQRDEAERQRDRAQYEAQRASAVSNFVESLLQSVAPSGRAYTMTELLDRGRILLEADHREDPRFVARMMVELLANYYNELNDRPRETALLIRADQLASSANDPELVARASCLLADRQAFDGETEAAGRSLDRARVHLARTPRPQTEVRIECLQARSTLAGRMGHTDSALAFVREAVAVAQAAGDVGSHQYVGALNALSIALDDRGQVREALGATRAAMRAFERSGRASTLSMAVLRYSEAYYLQRLGELRTADSVVGVVIRSGRAASPERQEPSYMTLLSGDLALDLRQEDSAIARYQRGLADARSQNDTRSEVWALTRLGEIRYRQGRLQEADRLRARLSAVVADGQRWRVRLLQAIRSEALGETAVARQALLQLLPELGFPVRAAGSRHVTRVALYAAEMALASGAPRAADSLARQVLTVARSQGHDQRRSALVGASLLVAAKARAAIGDTTGAREALAGAQAPLAYGYGPDDLHTREARDLLGNLGAKTRP